MNFGKPHFKRIFVEFSPFELIQRVSSCEEEIMRLLKSQSNKHHTRCVPDILKYFGHTQSHILKLKGIFAEFSPIQLSQQVSTCEEEIMRLLKSQSDRHHTRCVPDILKIFWPLV